VTARPYRLGQRQAAVEETRARIVSAARALLAAQAGISAFTIDAVAQQAGVARMTVYYQFGSKGGLLEALFDNFAAEGLVQPLRAAFQQADPRHALEGLVAAFCSFWASDRVSLRRLRGLGAVDPEIERGIRARDQRRRDALTAVLGRISKDRSLPRPLDEAVDVLHAVTSFEFFDGLASAGRSAKEAQRIILELVRADLKLPAAAERRPRRQKRS
jgi:AcrR family transcriptional regulator